MKIVQTPVRFYPFVGGVERYVLDLSAELAKLGNTITVACANEPRSDVSEVKGIHVRRLPYFGKIANTNITLTLPFSLLKEDCDIVHTHIPTPWSADISAFVSMLRHKPLIVTYHNDILKDRFAGVIATVYNNTLLRFVLAKADRILITQPNYLRTSNYLLPYANKIEVIPCGVDLEKFQTGETKKRSNQIFFLSVLDRHHRYKGLDYLIESLVLVKKRIPNIRLVIGGKGELVEEYKALAAKLHLAKNVSFAGYVSEEKKLRLYAESALFVLPSTEALEGFGIVLLEALACRTPVVATSIVGIAKDIQERRCGVIVKGKDSHSLAVAILHILKSAKRSEEMGRRGRDLVEEKYCWKNIAENVVKVYSGALDDKQKEYS